MKNTSMEALIARQVAVSRVNFGPNERTKGVIEHIREELDEIEAESTPHGRAEEWLDVAILAFDGLTRAIREGCRNPNETVPVAGYEPTNNHIAQTAVTMYAHKVGKNELREWPDWRTVSEDNKIDHVRGKHD
jgi:hypothetical protein